MSVWNNIVEIFRRLLHFAMAFIYSKSKWKLIDYPVKDVLGELEKNVKNEKTAEKKIGRKVEKKVKTVEKSETGKDSK